MKKIFLLILLICSRGAKCQDYYEDDKFIRPALMYFYNWSSDKKGGMDFLVGATSKWGGIYTGIKYYTTVNAFKEGEGNFAIVGNLTGKIMFGDKFYSSPYITFSKKYLEGGIRNAYILLNKVAVASTVSLNQTKKFAFATGIMVEFSP